MKKTERKTRFFSWWALRDVRLTFREPAISGLQAQLASESRLANCHWQFSPRPWSVIRVFTNKKPTAGVGILFGGL